MGSFAHATPRIELPACSPELLVQTVEVAQVGPCVVEPAVGALAAADGLEVKTESDAGRRFAHQVMDEQPALRVREEHARNRARPAQQAVVRQQVGDRDPGELPRPEAGQVVEPAQIECARRGPPDRIAGLTIHGEPLHNAQRRVTPALEQARVVRQLMGCLVGQSEKVLRPSKGDDLAAQRSMVEDDQPVGARLVDAMDGRARMRLPDQRVLPFAQERGERPIIGERHHGQATPWLRDVEATGPIIVHVVRTHRLAVGQRARPEDVEPHRRRSGNSPSGLHGMVPDRPFGREIQLLSVPRYSSDGRVGCRTHAFVHDKVRRRGTPAGAEAKHEIRNPKSETNSKS